jgi:hypothetical protein
MLFSLRSMALSSALIAASPLVVAASPRADGSAPEAPPAAGRAEPVVTDDPAVPEAPDELAVPALLVPGDEGEAIFAELPAPLGSLPELLRPPALAGPDGTPLTAAVPAPGEPALGDPTALPLPAEAPLAAPPALCANALAGSIEITIATTADANDVLTIGNSLFHSTTTAAAGSVRESVTRRGGISGGMLTPRPPRD